MPIIATHRLRRENGVALLDIELARRGMRVADLARNGIQSMTLHRLRNGEPGTPGAQTTTRTAHKIAAALDADHADDLIALLFEPIADTTR